MPYIDFAALKEAVSIEDVANLLDLKLKQAGNQFRCECPVHGGGERGMVITPSKNLFYCFKAGNGGDQLALYAHVQEIEAKQAAAEIAGQMGNGTVTSTEPVARTSSPTITKTAPPPQPAFDPEKFAARLVWHEEVAKLGLTEEDAKRMGVGFHPQQKHVFFPIKNPDGSFSAFIGVKDGRVKMPPQWLASQGNVVKLRRA